ncbi:MAG: efflux RND transporter periplasmic adaptor subunit [Pseudomonadota bacterium]
MMKKTTVAAAVAGIAVIAALVWAFAPKPIEVEAAAVERGRFEQSIDEDGRTRLRDRYVISAPVTARVSRISMREGDTVKAGDVVAVLTPVMASLYDERSMREAVARAKAAQAGVAGADARVERSRLSQEEARLEFQRTARLAGEGFLSASRLDSARLALSGAQRELQVAQAAREVAVYERAQAQAAVQPASPQAPAGQPLSIRAPISGVVLRLPVQSEGTIAAGAALMDIGDPSHLEVVAQLLTTDAVRAVPGTRAVIERWGGPALEGRVRRVEPAAFTKVSALGIEEQRVNVLVDVMNPPPAWLQMGDGFRVTVRVVVVSAADAILVPVGALFPDAKGGMAAYVIDSSRVRLTPMALVARNASVGWVRGGVQPGEQVVVYAPPSVADGSRVKVRKP